MILENILPVFGLIAAGALMRQRGLTDAAFLQTGDRLVYYVFFPVLLFWKIGGTAAGPTIPWRWWAVGLGTILVIWLLSLVLIGLLRIGRRSAGDFSQASYRFNTYVAIAIVATLQGDRGVARLGELLALAIPLCNVLAVATFIWFSRESLDQRTRVRLTLRALGRNPLIIGCAAGMLWVRLAPAWPPLVENTLQLASALTLPYALISIGGSLTFAGLRRRLVPAAAVSVLKLAVMPLVGWWALGLAGLGTDDRITAMVFFALPASTAMYVLSYQLDGDAELCSAAIVLTTLGSLASLSVVLQLTA